MPAFQDIREGVGEAFDALRAEFFEIGDVTFLKQNTVANAFTELFTVSAAWFLEYSEYRQNFLLQIADDLDAIDVAVDTATHLRVGDGDIYVIRNGDTIPPQGTDPTWKFFCDKFTERSQFRALY